MRHLLSLFLSFSLALSISAQPSWIKQGNIYEVNVRQYTKEGTFKAFSKSLDRLKNMGVQTLWFMPINPISKVDRKGTMGSYYAVADYKMVNPEFGTMKDFQDLVRDIHAKGMKVLIDWVPNHTGADHSWIKKHPDFYVKDSTGKPAIPYNWDDTRQLDFGNPVMVDSMISSMKYWITNADIDGFRIDVAWNVPEVFWTKCIPQLRSMKKDFFMLAEGDKPYLAKTFDAVYPWTMFHQMEKIAAGERPAFSLDSIKAANDTLYPKKTIQMYFTSNHDENSWNKADYGTFPGAVHAPFAVFTQTMANSVPLVYSGQEEPVLRPLAFFEKDPIEFGKYGREKFYKTLLELRKNNPALASNASFRKVPVGDTSSVYAYVREKGNKKIFVVLNLSNKEQTVEVHDIFLMGNAYNVFAFTNEKLTTAPWKLEPWGFVIYEY